MLYIFAIVVYIGACFRLARALSEVKPLLVERSAPATTLSFLQWALWLFVIPCISAIFPLSLLWPEQLPFLLTLALFLPAIGAAWYVLRQLPKGGYYYQRRAAGHVREVIWLGARGATILIIGMFLFPLLDWVIAPSAT